MKSTQALILGLYSDANVVVSYQIPTYKAKLGWVGLGYWKSNVSLYPNKRTLIAAFKEKHLTSINFKLTEELPEADVKQVIERTMDNRE